MSNIEIIAPRPAVTDEVRAALAQLTPEQAEAAKAWLEKLQKLTKLEHSVYHWYVTSHCSKKHCVRELQLLDMRHFDEVGAAIKNKLGYSLREIREMRDAEAPFGKPFRIAPLKRLSGANAIRRILAGRKVQPPTVELPNGLAA